MQLRAKSKSWQWGWGVLAAALSLALVLAPGLAAADIFYNDGGTHPVTGDITDVNETVGATSAGVGTTVTQSAWTSTLSGDLTLGRDAGASGAYELSGAGSLSANNTYIGYTGTGAFTQSSGTHTVTSDLTLGNLTGGSGLYNLSGGTVFAANEYVGATGSGTFTQSGGSNRVATNLYLGNTAGASGAYDLSGGTLHANSEYVGYSGSGSFIQSGGSNRATNNLYLGNNAGASGAYDLSGGTLQAAREYVGYFGSGTFTQSGGSILANYEYVGYSGSGTFTQSGGTNRVGTNLYLGNSAGASGAYTLGGGSLQAGQEFVGAAGNGSFTQSSGTHLVGTLCLGNSNSGSGAYNLSGGSLQANLFEYVGYSGSGSFTQSGGSNTVVGTLTLGVSSGGSGIYTLNAGSLVTGGVTIGPVGSGTFTQSGGTLTATGAGNTLFLGISSGSSGTYNLQGGSLSVSGDEVVAGWGGSGSFTQSGGTHTVTGALTLAADSGSSGTYNLSGGSLRVYGTEYLRAGGTFTHTGGTNTVNTLDLSGGGSNSYNLSGAGVLQALNVVGNLTNAGTVSPGNSVGTMNVVGSYAQTAAGTLVLEIASATSYDKIAVTGSPGTATLAGTLQPLLLAGYRPATRTLFADVITATGGVSGTFSSIYGGRQWQAIYHSNSVDLRYLGLSYADPALGLTRNQYSVGYVLDSVAANAAGDLATVLNAIDNLPNGAAVGDAYQQISPEKAGALPVLGFADFYARYRGLAQRVTNTRFGGGEGGLALGPGGFNLNYSKASGLMLAYNSSSLAGLITGKKKEAGTAERWGLYLEPNVVLGNRSGTVNNTGYNFTTAGFTLGADYRVRDDLLVGLATGYSHTGANFKGSGGNAENNAWPILAYAAYLPNNFYAFGSLGYTLNLFNLNRQIGFDVISRTAKGSTTGNQFNLYGETGYDLKCKRAVLTPMFSLAYSQIWVDSFTEDGADSLNLKVGAQKASSLQTGVGAKATMVLKIKACAVLPQVYATYQHEFADNARGIDARLSQGSSTTTWTVDRAGRDFAVVGGNLAVGLKKNLNLRLDYNAEVGRRDYTAHNINAGLRWQF